MVQIFMTPPSGNVAILDGLPEEHVDDALSVIHEAFAKKFCIGFRSAEDLILLFRDSVDRGSCITGIVDGRLSGILAVKKKNRTFYNLGIRPLLTTFGPLKTLRALLNLGLLSLEDSVKADEFKVETIAVDPNFRGMGIGSALMKKAEEQARSLGMRKMTLDVICENTGAIRLYKRLGYRITHTEKGCLVRLAVKSEAVHRMEKPLAGA